MPDERIGKAGSREGAAVLLRRPTSNYSELRGTEEIAAGVERIAALDPLRPEQRGQGHFGVGSLGRAGAAADLSADHQRPTGFGRSAW